MVKKGVAALVAATLLVSACGTVQMPSQVSSANTQSPHHDRCEAEALKVAEAQKKENQSRMVKSGAVTAGVATVATAAMGFGFGLNPGRAIAAALPLIVSAGAGGALFSSQLSPELQQVANAAYQRCMYEAEPPSGYAPR